MVISTQKPAIIISQGMISNIPSIRRTQEQFKSRIEPFDQKQTDTEISLYVQQQAELYQRLGPSY